MYNTNISILRGNKIELHYWFNDDSHTMDAFIQNKCEYEFLAILKEITSKLKIDTIVITEPLVEGGLIRYFKIIAKNEKKSAVIITALIISLLTTLITTPLTASLSKLSELLIEKIFEDSELKELEKEKLKLEIKKLRQETDINIQQLENNNIVKKRRSNFYKTLDGYSKVEKISISVSDENNIPISKEYIVPKNKFKDFILLSNDLEPIQLEEQIIEIVSPDLKGGKYKWKGIYNNEIIAFSMKSKEFNKQIKQGKIEFKNGSSIKCDIDIEKMLDDEGNEKIKNIIVVRVLEYFENDKPIETPEGKRKRQQKEAEKNILKFNFGDEYN